jgi:hypothetical protein
VTTSPFIKITTRWSSGPSEEWRYLGHQFHVGGPLPASLLEEIVWEVNLANSDEHYRGCSVDVEVPPLAVAEAELLRATDQFKSAEDAVRVLDDLVATLRSGGAK